MKQLLKTDELERKSEISDIVFDNSDDEKTKADSFQEEICNIFNYGAVRQVEKFF